MGTSNPAVRRLSTAPQRNWIVAALCALIVALAAVAGVQELGSSPAPDPAAKAELSSIPEARLAPVSQTGARTRAETLPAAATAAVSARLGRDLPAYAVHPGQRGSLAVHTPDQRLSSRFSTTGVRISTGRAQLSLALTGLDRRTLATHVAPRLRNGRISYGYPGTTAWYANGPLGIEQGFTVTQPSRLTTLRLTTSGLRPHLTAAGVRFGTQLRYVDLRAEGARGRPLHAWLSVDRRTVVIHVRTAGARFPIRIDPLVQSATLEPTDARVTNFGISVALAGDLLVVGDPTTVTSSGDETRPPPPAAYVFQQGQSGWSDATQVAELTEDSTNSAISTPSFGAAVAISPNGEVIAVGAPNEDLSGKGEQRGAVYLYDEPGTPSGTATGWGDATESSYYTPPDGTSGEYFGSAVSLTDGLLAVGAPGADGADINDGAAFLYTEPTGGWVQAATPVEFDGAGDEQLGASLALSPDGSTLVLGAPYATVEKVSDVGEVRVLTEPVGGWGSATPATAVLIPSDPNEPSNADPGRNLLGYSVAISADGSTVAAGVPGQDENADASDSQGAVDVFVKPSGGWAGAVQTAELYDSDFTAAADESLGTAVAFAGSSVIAGSEDYSDGAGAVYEFDQPSGGWSSEPQDTLAGPTVTASANSQDDGAAVAGDSDSLVVGDLGGDDGAGSALVYGYSAPAGTTSSSTPSTSTSTPSTSNSPPAPATQPPVTSTTPPESASTLDFSTMPSVEPALIGQTLSFAASGAENGDGLIWHFGDGDTGEGATTSHTFASAGVFTITLSEYVNGQAVQTVSHNQIVVQAQPPDANLSVIRTDQQGGNGGSTAVTDPVTFVPQATLPQVDASAQDSITRIEYYFDTDDLDLDQGKPDLTCYPNGTCTQAPGVTVLGTGAVYPDGTTTQPAGCGRVFDPQLHAPVNPACQTDTPTSGFPSIQVNFWDAALAQMGDATNSWASTPRVAVNPQLENVEIQNGSNPAQYVQPPLTTPYPDFGQLREFDQSHADGYMGEQGVPDEDCFPGDVYPGNPLGLTSYSCGSSNVAILPGDVPGVFPGVEPYAPSSTNVPSTPLSYIFGPYDLSHYGVNSNQQLEDQWNLLYNYATVVGLDTPLNQPFGPATGATVGAKHAVVPREVTMVAYNAEGQASQEATEQVPLTPAALPSFSVCIEDVTGGTPCVVTPKHGSSLPFTIDVGDQLRFEINGVTGKDGAASAATGTVNGGDEPISTYAIAVGQPNTQSVRYGDPAESDSYEGTTDQCGAADAIGSWYSYPGSGGPTSPVTTTPVGKGTGTVSSVAPETPPTGPVDKAGPARRSVTDLRRAHDAGAYLAVPAFSDLLAGAFPPHDCEDYSARTVDAAPAVDNPGKVPASGPTVILHSAGRTANARSPHLTVTNYGPQPTPGDSYSSLAAATSPTIFDTAPTVATGDPTITTQAEATPTQPYQAPILITPDAQKLDFAFAKAGTYSTSIAAYNSAGLGSVTRIDGFLAQTGSDSGFCLNVSSQPLTVPRTVRLVKGQIEKASTGLDSLGFSGSCMTVVASQTSPDGKDFHPNLYVSTVPIDVDGVPLAPAPGDSIVINPNTDDFYVAKCTITTADLKHDATDHAAAAYASHLCPFVPGSTGSANPPDLYLALGTASQGGQTLPGFARIGGQAGFSTATADAYFASLNPDSKGSLGTVGSTPSVTLEGTNSLALTAAIKSGGIITSDGITSCGLYPFSQPWSNAPNAEYDGFPIASKNGPCIAFTPKSAEARVGFWDSLPQAFSNGASAEPDSSQVLLYGSDLPAVSDLSYHQYANVALRSRHHIAGDFPTLAALSKAEAAKLAGASTQVRTDDDELPGFPNIPTCPPSTNGKSGLSIPDNTNLGPITLPVGASFCYEAKTGDFIGNAKVNIPGPKELGGVEVGFEIGHGHLIDAGGELSGTVPVFPGVDINDFKFDIQTDPTQVAAAITASIANILSIEGGVVVNPSKKEVIFDGNVGILGTGITFGNFSLDYKDGNVGMSVSFYEDYGVASLNATVKGAYSDKGQGSPDFYLQGSAKLCLFVCLGAEGLISNDGLAACGSINLVVTTLSAGFAVLWNGPNSGVHLFTGCDLTPYIPANLVNVTTGSNRVASSDGGLARAPGRRSEQTEQPNDDPSVQTQQVVNAGQTENLNGVLNQPGMCPYNFSPITLANGATYPSGTVFTPTNQPGKGLTGPCTTQTVAVQVHSIYDPSDPGATPLVQLTNDGGDSRTPGTPTSPGYWGMAATAGVSGGVQTADEGTQTDDGMALIDQNPVPVVDDVAGSTADETATGAPCPDPDTETVTSLPACGQKVTTTTIYIADPGPGTWTLHVLPGSEPVVDYSVAGQMPQVTPTSIGDTVDKASVVQFPGGAGDDYDIKIGGHTYPSSAITSHHVLLSSSVLATVTSTARTAHVADFTHPDDLDVAPIDAALLRSISLKLPTNFPGTVSIIDQGTNCGTSCAQVLTSGLTAASLSGGVPLLFEPLTSGKTQTIEAFISNAEGMPSRVIDLATIKSPATPAPDKPVLERTVRDGSVVHLFVNVRDTPTTGAISLALHAGNGAQYDESFNFNDGSMQPVASSPYTGVGAARQHTVWEITVPNVDPTSSLHVALDSSNEGVLSASTAQRPIKPFIHAMSHSALLSKLHLKL